MAMTSEAVEAEAWRLLLMYAESGVEDDIDEDGEFDEDTYDEIQKRAMALICELRRQHVPGGNDGRWPPA